MHPNIYFVNRDSSFWAYAKLLSEQLGYSKKGKVLFHTREKSLRKLEELNIEVDIDILDDVLQYLEFRANVLNRYKNSFMNVEKAREQFKETQKLHRENHFTSSQPLNKQKGEKRDFAYFTCIINTITEAVLRKFAIENDLNYGEDISFNDDPRNLTYLTDKRNQLKGIMSRRFDGAFPSTVNPILIWEIKEYYYTTTFGSRIADGVYETQLDGYEIKTIREETDKEICHIYFIDDYNTWWDKGKSYLCRIIDMLHMGLVDEVIFGEEVFDRWPQILNAAINTYYDK